jgi:hypothetical protein
LHCETYPPPDHDDAFMVSGLVEWVSDGDVRRALARQFLAERRLAEPWPGFDRQELVEFTFDRCLLTLTIARDGLPDGHTIWRADPARVKRRFRPSSKSTERAPTARE